MSRWVVEVQEDDGGYILPLPEDMLQEVGWKEGDVIEWIDNKDGSWSMRKKMTKLIQIEQCSDMLMWYADQVGNRVPFIREDDQYYWSRDSGGYLNIVLKSDATIVEV